MRTTCTIVLFLFSLALSGCIGPFPHFVKSCGPLDGAVVGGASCHAGAGR